MRFQKTSHVSPYQPLIFRCLHIVQGILLLLTMATGYWIFNTWDRRWLVLPLPRATEFVIELHEEVGGIFAGAIALFILYSILSGRRRLLQPNSLSHFTKIGRPIWWYTLHRLVNTGLLIMGGLVVLSGDALDDDAMMAGQFSDLAYSLHIFAWAAITVLLISHLLLSVKVGGIPLLLSPFSRKIRIKDLPIYWPKRILSRINALANRL
ncbi:MAG: cytochrome b/b6 domain-containing protein [Cyanobacteria bacterium J06632_3]